MKRGMYKCRLVNGLPVFGIDRCGRMVGRLARNRRIPALGRVESSLKMRKSL